MERALRITPVPAKAIAGAGSVAKRASRAVGGGGVAEIDGRAGLAEEVGRSTATVRDRQGRDGEAMRDGAKRQRVGRGDRRRCGTRRRCRSRAAVASPSDCARRISPLRACRPTASPERARRLRIMPRSAYHSPAPSRHRRARCAIPRLRPIPAHLCVRILHARRRSCRPRQLPRLPVVVQARLEQRHQPLVQLRVLHRHRALRRGGRSCAASSRPSRCRTRASPSFAKYQMRECSRNRPTMLITRMCSRDARHAAGAGSRCRGRSGRSRTPACDARYSASIISAIDQRVHLGDDPRRPPGRARAPPRARSAAMNRWRMSCRRDEQLAVHALPRDSRSAS